MKVSQTVLALVLAASLGQRAATAQEGIEPTPFPEPIAEESNVSLPPLTVTPKPITLPVIRADYEDVRVLQRMMEANKTESALELFLRIASIVEQQAQQIAALDARVKELEGK